MRTRIRSHRLFFPCLCLVALASTSCENANDLSSSLGSTVIVAVPDVTVLLPDETDADFLVFLPLATLDKNGELLGRLAKSWEHSADYRQWTYHLRTNVRWHDGVPVTAHDVKFTLDLLSHPDVLEYPHLSATVLNDSTVTIMSPGEHRYKGDVVYYPKHLLEHFDPKEFRDWQFWNRPVGNGPYRFVRHLPQTMIEFEANPDYYRGKPRIERVVLKFVGEARVTELLSGNVDAILYANPVQIPQLAADPRFRVYYSFAITGTGRAIYWQNTYPLFSDPRVRRALTLAINRRELLKVLNLPEDLPIVDGVFTPRQFRRGQLPDPLPYDPAGARTLLDAAGWRDPVGDGVRKRKQQPFSFTAIVANRPEERQMAVYVQDQLRQVGVQMGVQILDPFLVWERARAGEFEAAFFLVQESSRFHEQYFGRESPIGYRNTEVVKLIDRALTTPDPGGRDQIYSKLREIFRRDVPVTFLHSWNKTFLVHRRIKGLSTPFRADPTKYMEDLWLEEDF